MEKRLWSLWAQAPWHAWLKDSPQWSDLFVAMAVKLPHEVVVRLLNPIRPLILLPPVNQSRVVRIQAELKAGAHILQLDAALLGRPREEALAILAHEMAHLCLPATGDPEKDDLAADALAATWGFGTGLAAAVTRDGGPGHPRVRALTESPGLDDAPAA